MSAVFQENKMFINKFLSLLNIEAKKSCKGSIDLSIPVKIDGRTYKIPVITEYTMVNQVFTEEVGKNVYFCVKMQSPNRFIFSKMTDQSDLEALAFNVFIRSYGKYSITDSELNDLKNYTLSKGITTSSRGKPISACDSYDFVADLKMDSGRISYYFNVFKDYPAVKTLINYMEKIKAADVDMIRGDFIFKSIKNRDAIPVAIFDGDSDTLRVPSYKPSSPTSTAFYEKVSLAGNNSLGRALKYNANACFLYTPFSLWVVPIYKCSFIDLNDYIKLNFKS